MLSHALSFAVVLRKKSNQTKEPQHAHTQATSKMTELMAQSRKPTRTVHMWTGTRYEQDAVMHRRGVQLPLISLTKAEGRMCVGCAML